MCLELCDNSCNCFVNTALEVHRVGSRSHILQTDIDDGLGKDSGCGSTVTCLLVGLGSDFLHHLCTHVGKLVLKLHFLGYSDTVLCHLRCAEFLVYNDIAAFRSKCNLDCICKCICAFLHLGAGVDIEFYIFCHNIFLLIIKVLRKCQTVS